MNCLECRELLHQRLDGLPIAAEAIEQHVMQCETCRAQHAGAALLLEGLKKLAEPMLPAGFTRSMVAQVMRDREHRQVKMRRRVFATLALAASVLILLFLAYNWLPRTQPVDQQPKDIVKKVQPKPPAPRNDEPQVAPKPDEAPGWAGSVRDHAKVVLAAANFEGVDRLPVTPQVREAGQEVSVGVEAVTRSTRKAFDYFARELPMPTVGAH